MRKKHFNYSSTNDIYYHYTYQASPSTKISDDNYVRTTEWHLGVEVFLLLKGKVSYFVKGLEITVEPGDLLVIPPNTAHSLISDARLPFERMVLSFPVNYLPRLSGLEGKDVISSFSDFNYLIPKEYVDKFQLNNLLRQCKSICSSKTHYTDLLLIAQISKIVCALYETHKLLPPSIKPTPKRVSRVYEFVQFINDNVTKNITVRDVANHFFLSPSHVANAFKREVGVPVTQYITNQKMLLACKLLLDGIPATEVATMIGYDNYYTFFRNFKAKTKLMPKNYIDSRRINNINAENTNDINSYTPLNFCYFKQGSKQ